MLKEIVAAASIACTSGCAMVKQEVELSSDQQARLHEANAFINDFFKPIGEECLRDSRIVVVQYHEGFSFTGTYNPFDKSRDISISNFNSHGSEVEEDLLHESIHAIVDCGVLDVSRFWSLYQSIDPGQYEIKRIVEDRLENYWMGHRDEERLAYTATLFMLDTSYVLPSAMAQYLEGVFYLSRRAARITAQN